MAAVAGDGSCGSRIGLVCCSFQHLAHMTLLGCVTVLLRAGRSVEPPSQKGVCVCMCVCVSVLLPGEQDCEWQVLFRLAYGGACQACLLWLLFVCLHTISGAALCCLVPTGTVSGLAKPT
jgi:hypothetical protein